MSSLHLAPQVALGGIFETSKKNPWAAANVAYVPYCSSDAWVGDAGASESTFGWHFRGQRILAAVLASLVQTQGLGSHTGLGVAAEAQRLLLAGCSAGARGAMMNLDYVSGILADVGVTSEQVAVQGLLDRRARSRRRAATGAHSPPQPALGRHGAGQPPHRAACERDAGRVRLRQRHRAPGAGLRGRVPGRGGPVARA